MRAHTYTCNVTVQGVGRSQSVGLQSLTSKLFAYGYLLFSFINYGLTVVSHVAKGRINMNVFSMSVFCILEHP